MLQNKPRQVSNIILRYKYYPALVDNKSRLGLVFINTISCENLDGSVCEASVKSF